MLNLAVLIDAENMRASIATELFERVLTLGGAAPIRRIYGNWASSHLQEWGCILDRFAIRPIHQPSYVTGKNASDMALVIDAMDLLHRFPEINGFCIVSSDSDFTPLMLHLRESQKIIYGFGKNNTPNAFKNVCHQFTILETAQNTLTDNPKKTPHRSTEFKKATVPKSDLSADHHSTSKKQSSKINRQTSPKRDSPQELKNNKKLIIKIQKTLDSLQSKADASGYILLSRIATELKKIGFSQKQYGYARLSDLLKAMDFFELKKAGKHYTIKNTSV